MVATLCFSGPRTRAVPKSLTLTSRDWVHWMCTPSRRRGGKGEMHKRDEKRKGVTRQAPRTRNAPTVPRHALVHFLGTE